MTSEYRVGDRLRVTVEGVVLEGYSDFALTMMCDGADGSNDERTCFTLGEVSCATIERIADPRLAVVTQIMCDGGNEQAQRILDALDAHAKKAGR